MSKHHASRRKMVSKWIQKEDKMNERTEAVVSIVAAMLVLLSAMLDPRISVGLAIAFLVVLATYKLAQSKRNKRSI